MDAAAASAASVELCVVDGDDGRDGNGGGAEADVCRVCMGGAEEETGDGPLVELSCRCRGGMRLAHAACAEKWFLSRGASRAAARRSCAPCAAHTCDVGAQMSAHAD
jgi:E3 ubiquitin-protein ligase DOA10